MVGEGNPYGGPVVATCGEGELTAVCVGQSAANAVGDVAAGAIVVGENVGATAFIVGNDVAAAIVAGENAGDAPGK